MKPKRQAEVAKLEAGLESLLSHATLSGENETAKQRQGMYERKPRRAWSVSDTSPPQDSGSESAPLLSSGTHMSFSPMIFHDSDTSDLDFSPIADSPRYGSAGTSNFNSMAILPRRVPLLAHDSPLITSHQTNISPPPPYCREGYYQIHNSLSDLVIDDSICKDGGTRPIIKEVGRGFLPGPLPLIQDPPPITSKSTKRTQSSLVTM